MTARKGKVKSDDEEKVLAKKSTIQRIRKSETVGKVVGKNTENKKGNQAAKRVRFKENVDPGIPVEKRCVIREEGPDAIDLNKTIIEEPVNVMA